MERYRERKKEYSNSWDEGSKGRMLDTLEDFIFGVCSMIQQLTKDADCREEREIISSMQGGLQKCNQRAAVMPLSFNGKHGTNFYCGHGMIYLSSRWKLDIDQSGRGLKERLPILHG